MAEVWIRPGENEPGYSGPYGNEDGSDYDNAYPGIENVVSPTAGGGPTVTVAGGDHVHIVGGAHAHYRTFATTTDTDFETPSGQANKPTIIDFSHPTNPGRMFMAAVLGGDIWTVHSGDARVADWTVQMGTRVVYDISADGESHTVLTSVADAATCVSTADSFFYDSDNEKMYVHLGDADKDPTDRVCGQQGGWQIECRGKEWIFIRGQGKRTSSGFVYDIEQQGSDRTLGNSTSVSSARNEVSHLRMYRMHIRGGGNGDLITFWMDATDNKFHRCHFEEATNGIYLRAQDEDDLEFPATNFVWSRCSFNRFGKVTGDGDQHAIGIQGGGGHKIIRCSFDEAGKAVEAFCGGSQSQDPPLIVNRCRFGDMHDDQGTLAGGLADNTTGLGFTGGTADPVTFRRAVVTQNVFRGSMGKGISGSWLKNSETPNLDINNNHFEDVKNALRNGVNIGGVGPSLKFHNNTVLNPVERFIWIPTGAPDYILDFDNNTYTGTPSESGFMLGGVEQTFAQWQANGATFDPNSTGPS